jgi:hypothetical protein
MEACKAAEFTIKDHAVASNEGMQANGPVNEGQGKLASDEGMQLTKVGGRAGF